MFTTEDTEDTEKFLKMFYKIRKLVYKTLQSVFQSDFIKVNKQSGFDFGKAHVSQNLRLVDWKQFLDGFKLNNHFVLNKNINPVTAIESDSFIINRQSLLKFERHSATMQFMSKALFISRLKQSWTKLTVNGDGAGNYFFCVCEIIHVIKLIPKKYFTNSVVLRDLCGRKKLEIISHG